MWICPFVIRVLLCSIVHAYNCLRLSFSRRGSFVIAVEVLFTRNLSGFGYTWGFYIDQCWMWLDNYVKYLNHGTQKKYRPFAHAQWRGVLLFQSGSLKLGSYFPVLRKCLSKSAFPILHASCSSRFAIWRKAWRGKTRTDTVTGLKHWRWLMEVNVNLCMDSIWALCMHVALFMFAQQSSFLPNQINFIYTPQFSKTIQGCLPTSFKDYFSKFRAWECTVETGTCKH